MSAQSDPNGIDQHAPGAKLDAGKVRPSLILGPMARALLAVSEVGTYGANKYSDGGWQHVPDALKRYTDARDRHQLFEAIEPDDSESGLKHAAHAAWNALARLELILRADAASEQCGQLEDHESILSNWKLWKKGDIVEALESAGSIKKGDSYMLQRDSDESGDVHFFDDGGDLRNRSCIDYRFVCRPTSTAK